MKYGLSNTTPGPKVIICFQLVKMLIEIMILNNHAYLSVQDLNNPELLMLMTRLINFIIDLNKEM